MEGLVILTLPVALVLYGAALFFALFDLKYRPAKPWPVLLSAFLSVGASAYSLLLGASLSEVATVLMIFLLLDLGVRE